MWLTGSSIGRKLVMAITGVCLVLFVTFHVLMNGVAIFWPAAYNIICEFLGANWYALVASAGLALLFIIHICYAVWLTVENRRARGNDRYAINSRPKQVEWASKNMLVLGIVILAFLVVHMIQFWAKMQLAEIMHCPATVDGQPVPPVAGTLFIHYAFAQWYTPVIYIIGFVALWFHMNHGFWSMFQTAGWNNDTWLPRLKTIGCWWTTIVVGLFIVEAVVFTLNANCDKQPYLNCPELQKQYIEFVGAAPCGKVCDKPCDKVCDTPCDTPCDKVCDKVCGKPCDKVCDTPCGKPCDKVCGKPCDTPCAKPACAAQGEPCE